MLVAAEIGFHVIILVLSENLNSDSFTPEQKDKNPDPPIDKKARHKAVFLVS